MMHITVSSLSEDFGKSTDLCGNYNGNAEDDMIPRGTSQPDRNPSEKVDFTGSYAYVDTCVTNAIAVRYCISLYLLHTGTSFIIYF